jgi:hypothetical protein
VTAAVICEIVLGGRLPAAMTVLLVGAALAAGCGGRASRSQQAAGAAGDAGLPSAVRTFVGKVAAGADHTFTVSYDVPASGSQPASQVTISQRPPNRRVDVVNADGTTDTTLRLGSTTYQCQEAAQHWRCAVLQKEDAGAAAGVLDEATLDRFTAALRKDAADYDMKVESRPLAGVTASCLVTTLKPAKRSDSSLGPSATMCIAGSGAVLLVERPGEQLTAARYATSVPSSVFQLPAPAEGTDQSTTTT